VTRDIVPAPRRAHLVRGKCSVCGKDVRGSGTDEFEALGDAEASHCAETGCGGEPVDVQKGFRARDGREAFPRPGVPSWSQIEQRPPPPPPMRLPKDHSPAAVDVQIEAEFFGPPARPKSEFGF